MKALSLWQPHATLWVTDGAKDHETRSWGTPFRGLLAVHAAQKWTKELSDLCWADPFKKALWFDGVSTLPRGCIVGVVRVVACERITADNIPPSPDWDFGDYTPGRFMWRAVEKIKLKKPIPWKGHQGFFEVPDDVLNNALEAQAAAITRKD